MNTAMRNAAIKALNSANTSVIQERVIRSLKADMGTKSRALYADISPSAYPANQLTSHDVCEVRRQRVLCRLKGMVQ